MKTGVKKEKENVSGSAEKPRRRSKETRKRVVVKDQTHLRENKGEEVKL